MIAGFVSVEPSPDRKDFIRIAFVDTQDCSWFLDVLAPLTPQGLFAALNTINLTASHPQEAILLGIITQEAYDGAIAARNAVRLTRSLGEDVKVQ